MLCCCSKPEILTIRKRPITQHIGDKDTIDEDVWAVMKRSFKSIPNKVRRRKFCRSRRIGRRMYAFMTFALIASALPPSESQIILLASGDLGPL